MAIINAGSVLMRKVVCDLNMVKAKIAELKGQVIKMEVNSGRRRIKCYEGVLEDTYNSVFVVRLSNETGMDTLSYSYSDVLCGDVKIAVKVS
ncbi:MAG: Veg family protein [Firmicutes bacterium]|nr:Veg family protein [Bacillota bacterium]